jgi:putative nucleotidyltransferase with HDIG domain
VIRKKQKYGQLVKLISDSVHDQKEVDNPVLTAILGKNNQWDMLFEVKPPVLEKAAMGLLMALFLKDPNLLHHSIRVAKYAALLSGWLKLTPEEVQEATWVSLFHDVGKIGVSDDILQFPGTLSMKQFDVMKRHAQYSADLVSAITSNIPLIEGVRFHHERFDGYGYPKGISGAEIPKSARICLIVDSFDAMSSNRPYRSSFQLTDVFSELKSNMGSQFDSDLGNCFMSKMSQMIQEVEQELGIETFPKVKRAA